MKIPLILLGTALALSACTTATVEPIPGSITYNGQPHTKLTKSPVGSTFEHRFYADGGEYVETYQIQPDRSLKLIWRRFLPDIIDDN